MIAYSIANDTILVIDNKEIDFGFNINKVLEIGDVLVVHKHDTYEKKEYIRSSEQPLNGVSAYSANGDLLWKIKDILTEDELYTGISVDDDGNLVVHTFTGVARIIDVKAKKSIGHFVTK